MRSASSTRFGRVIVLTLKAVDGCVLVVHGAGDRYVPVRFSEALYASEEVDLFRRLKRMARRERRTIVILHRHPLLTSDRKVRLYGWPRLFRFMLKTVVSRGRTLRSREDCFAWYDGER